MNDGKKLISRTIHTALAVGMATGVCAALPALGQTTSGAKKQKPKTLQAVIVTGSHIRRVNTETPSPVIPITAQQIQATGAQSLGAVIAQLPSVTGGKITPTVNNGNQPGPRGQTLVGLRGLGASRTLISVDGQRVVNKDINSIPVQAIRRIEVLTSGASSVYGSDAIGGVINILLKKNFHGAAVGLNYGISTHGDGQRVGGHFTFGGASASGKANFLAGVSYNKMDEILQGARSFSANPLSLTISPGNNTLHARIGGSTYGAHDHITVPQSVSTTLGCAAGSLIALNENALSAGTSPTNLGDYHCFGVKDKYNYAAAQALVDPQERENAFYRGSYQLSNNISVNITYYHNKTLSGGQLAPSLYYAGGGASISKDSFYNPFGVAFNGSSGNEYGIRTVTAGNRTYSFGEKTDQLMFSLNGNNNLFGHFWTWDLGYNFGHFEYDKTLGGVPSASILNAGAGPSFKNSEGTVQCGTASSPLPLTQCTPWDPFNVNAASTRKALAGAVQTGLVDAWQIERIYHADATGGGIRFASGYCAARSGCFVSQKLSKQSPWSRNAKQSRDGDMRTRGIQLRGTFARRL